MPTADYVPTNWVDNTTPVDQTRMNHLESGVDAATDGVRALEANPVIPTLVNGRWLKAVSGAMVWSDVNAEYQARTEKAAASGYASLDAGTKVPVAQIPDLSATYQVKSEKAAASGYASLDATGKVPAAQLPVTGGGATQFPIDFRNPNVAASPGGAFPGIVVGTVWEEWGWHFIDSGFGLIYGVVRVPEDATPTAPRFKFEFTGAAAGNASLGCDLLRLVAGSALNAGTFTQQFTVTQAISAGRLLTRWAPTITLTNVVAGDLMVVRFYRDGANAADTMVGDLSLLGGWLSLV